MNKLILLLLPLSLFAKLNIAVSYPYIGALVEEIAQDKLKITVLAKGNWDPHFVVPKPSLIVKLRRSDALIMNGGQLEIGWLPPLIRRAANSKVHVNTSSFLNLSHQVQMIQIPVSVDRSLGDVHPDGNPHFHLDPNNILVLAKSITRFLIQLDAENKTFYEKNLNEFTQRWNNNLLRWKTKMQAKKGMKILQFHDNLAYFNKAYGLESIATIEPLPGIPPSSKHVFKLISLIESEKPQCILHDVYHSTKTAKYLKNKTNIKIILMPHDINALDGIESLENLFDYLVKEVSNV
ncbi:zinc ABC transporter substrate-binding protein [Sulfurimonas sp. MAG313]|nr:zinc ABC transporter substrate-binding protein [Sulfurimonas sp. MAG313]MDF1880181.1 zinc ABC transporter substrate-binding protein [Sulfurimonas sp. MAG313]